MKKVYSLLMVIMFAMSLSLLCTGCATVAKTIEIVNEKVSETTNSFLYNFAATTYAKKAQDSKKEFNREISDTKN